MSLPAVFRPVASGLLCLRLHPAGVPTSCSAELWRAEDGAWRCFIWPAGALVPVVAEGAGATPLCDAVLGACFSPAELERAGGEG